MSDVLTEQQVLAARLGSWDRDISPNFRYNATDAAIGQRLIGLEGTPQAVQTLWRLRDQLTDHAYWFFLGTLWVSYSGYSDLKLWRTMLLSGRKKRKTSLMKPSEVGAYDRLPVHITAYRAHRAGETDWISYTLDYATAVRFANERHVQEIAEYRMHKRDVIALFMRRGEQELLALWPKNARLVVVHAVQGM